jgi:hypothetical protein
LSLTESFLAEPPIMPNGIPTITHPTVMPKAIEFHTRECYSFCAFLLEIFLGKTNTEPQDQTQNKPTKYTIDRISIDNPDLISPEFK